MPSKSEKQRKFFGAVMGAKKGKGKVKGAAKKVAKEMPEKEIKKFLKKETYDEVVNDYLKNYLIEAYVEYEGGREDIDPREGMDEPNEDIDDSEDVKHPTDAQIMYQTVKDHLVEYYGGGVEGQQLAMKKLYFMDPDEIKEFYHSIENDEYGSGMSPPAESLREDEEDEHEHCEHAAEGCKCDGCEECKANQDKEEDCEGETKKAPILQFYGFTK